MFKTNLIGQKDIEDTFNKILENDDIPHIFLTGIHGSGKTTILKEFINYYFSKHFIKDTSEWIMNLSSEKDRGIHCIRQSVAEFVQHVSAKKNTYRWIIIDDADTLPIISQQALRRPMETHAHTTRFFFVSRYPSDLIAPLNSRCLHIEIEPISLLDYTHHALIKNNASFHIKEDALSLLLTLSHSCSQIETYIKILSHYYKNKTELTYEDINSLFSSPSYNINANIVQQFIKQDYNELLKSFFKIWSTGISYEDFLYELNNYIKQIGILNPQKSQNLYYLIMKGWIQFAQNKTHSFDMLRLMLNN